MALIVLPKSAGLPDKTDIFFPFCPPKTFTLSDKYPVKLSKENKYAFSPADTYLSYKILQSVRQLFCISKKDFAKTATTAII